MKNLAQKTTGEIIVISKLMKSEDKVIWIMYANGVLFKQGIPYKDGQSPVNKTALPITYMNYPDYLDWIQEESVITEKPTYERVAKANDNWVFNRGVTNALTTLRVYVPHIVIGENAQTGNVMDLWLQSINSQKAFRTKDKMGIVQYLESILPVNETMLQGYAADGVVIDYKV